MSNRFDDQLDLTRFAAGSLVQAFEAADADPASRAAAVQHLEMTIEELAIASDELSRRLADLDAVTTVAERERLRYERLFARSPVASVVTDRVGIISEINWRALELFETTSEHALGRPLSAFIGRSSRREFRSRLAASDRGIEPSPQRIDVRRSLGRDEVTVVCELHRLADADETRPDYRWTFHDLGVEEPQRAAPPGHVAEMEAVTRRRDELEVDLAFRKVTATALTHDLRTPLAVIRGLAVSLGDVTIGEDQRRTVVAAIDRQSGRALRLIEDLMDLQEGHLTGADTDPDVDLSEMLRSLVDEVGVGDHEVVVSGVGDARVDAKVVRRIIANLLGNAVKMAPDGTRIDIRTWRAAGGLLLAVEDRGPGFGADQGGHVFEPYSRLDRDADLPGWGLGLSIVAELARLHGGAAWIVERSGGGGAVHVYLRSLPLDEASEPGREP